MLEKDIQAGRNQDATQEQTVQWNLFHERAKLVKFIFQLRNCKQCLSSGRHGKFSANLLEQPKCLTWSAGQ